MTPIELAIRQQEAAVELTRMLVKNRRASPQELDEANARLDELKAMRMREVVAETLAQPTPTYPKGGMEIQAAWVDEAETLLPAPEPVLATAPIYQRMQELVAQAKGLENQQALLADRLREVPTNQDCSELTEEIAELQGQINETWAEYRFVEQNKKLPEPEANAEPDPEREVELLRIARELKSLRDRRLKLEKKLEKPHLHTKNPGEKIPAWNKDLLLITNQIAELEYRREGLR